MTKKKVVVVHKMYVGNHVKSNKNQAFAKCLCGAVLEGQPAIDEHRLLLVDGPRNKSVGNVRGPSKAHPTAKAG